jgi:hypothetical protein
MLAGYVAKVCTKSSMDLCMEGLRLLGVENIHPVIEKKVPYITVEGMDKQVIDIVKLLGLGVCELKDRYIIYDPAGIRPSLQDLLEAHIAVLRHQELLVIPVTEITEEIIKNAYEAVKNIPVRFLVGLSGDECGDAKLKIPTLLELSTLLHGILYYEIIEKTGIDVWFGLTDVLMPLDVKVLDADMADVHYLYGALVLQLAPIMMIGDKKTVKRIYDMTTKSRMWSMARKVMRRALMELEGVIEALPDNPIKAYRYTVNEVSRLIKNHAKNLNNIAANLVWVYMRIAKASKEVKASGRIIVSKGAFQIYGKDIDPHTLIRGLKIKEA